MNKIHIVSLIDCLIDRLFGWLVDRLIDWLSIARMIDYPFDWVLDWLILFITHVELKCPINTRKYFLFMNKK